MNTAPRDSLYYVYAYYYLPLTPRVSLLHYCHQQSIL